MGSFYVYDNLAEGDFEEIIQLFKTIIESNNKNDFIRCAGLAMILDSRPEIDRIYFCSIHDPVDEIALDHDEEHLVNMCYLDTDILEEEMSLTMDSFSGDADEDDGYTEISIVGTYHDGSFTIKKQD